MTTFAAIDIALIVVTIGIGVKCALNFNKGLKNHVRSNSVRKAELEDGKPYYQPNEMSNLSYQGSAPMPSRMTIE